MTLISIKSTPVLPTSRKKTGRKLVRAISAESIYRGMLLFLGHILYHRAHFVRDMLCMSRAALIINYIGELFGIQIALHHISEQEELRKDIHFFIYCQPAIVSAFGSDTPRNKVDIILQIQQMTVSLEDKGHNSFSHNSVHSHNSIHPLL